MTTIYVVTKVARELDKTASDTLVAIDFLKAFRSKERAEKYVEELTKKTSRTEMIEDAECYVQIGVQPVEVVDLI
jgi:hypothetical protein